jgi:hypothetical protein
MGLSTTGTSSFGTALVNGRNRVPKPAAGITAFRMGFIDHLLLIAIVRPAKRLVFKKYTLKKREMQPAGVFFLLSGCTQPV